MPKLSEIIAALQDDLDKNGDTENFGVGIAVGENEKRGIYSYDGFQVIRDVNYVNGMTLLVGNRSGEFKDESSLIGLKQLMLDVLQYGEPSHVTHPMSLWNRVRRALTLLETGEQISTARSWDAQSSNWIV